MRCFKFKLFFISILCCEISCNNGEPSCYWLNHDSREFRTSAGGYDIEQVTQDTCKRFCAEAASSYVGLLSGEYCLCGNDTSSFTAAELSFCNKTCSGNSEEYCGSDNPDIIYVLEVEQPGAVKGVELSVEDKVFTTDDYIEYEIKVEASCNWIADVYFGDGTKSTYDQNTSTRFTTKRRYAVPGEYDVKVITKDDIGNSWIMSNEVTVTVEEKNTEYSLTCPRLVKPFAYLECPVIVWQGISTTVKLEIAEKDFSAEYNILDPAYVFIGHEVPVDLASQEELDISEKIVLLPYSEVRSKSRLRGLEFQMVKPGKFEFYILQPIKEKTGCSHGCNPWTVYQCPEDEVICSRTVQCIKQNPLTDCKSDFHQELKKRYKIRYSKKIESKDPGFNFDSSDFKKELDLYPGEIIGFKTLDDTSIGYRKSTDEDISSGLQDVLLDGNKELGVLHYLRMITVEPANVSLKFSFNTTGNHSFTVALSDAKGVYSESKAVLVQIPISNILVNLANVDNTVGDNVQIHVTGSGSDFKLILAYSDEETEEDFEDEIPDEGIFRTIACKSPGKHVLTAVVSNEWNAENASHEFSCFHPVKRDWSFSSDSPRTHPPGKISFNLKFDGKNLPSSAKYVVNYGDESDEESDAIRDGSDKWTKTLSHTYSSDGNYSVSLNISNPVSCEVFELTVSIFKKLGNLSVTTYFVKDGTYPEDRIQLKGKNKSDAPKHSTLYFECDISGHVTSFEMRSEDGSFELSSKENVLSHDFPEVGEWNVSFVAKDSDVNEQSNQISKQLRILSEVSNYVYNASATEGEIDESIEFTISLSEFDDYSCVVFDAADNSRLRAFGNEEVCTLHYDKEDFKFIEKPTDFARRKREIKDAMWKDESTISILNNYMYGGKFQPSVDVFNSVSRLKKNLTIFISYGDYDTPVLWIDENSTDSDRPIECKRGIDCRYETTAIFRNNQSYLAYHEWSIFKLDGTGSEEEIDISYLKTHNCSAIRILKRSLELGLYKLKYTLTIYAEDENVTHEEDLHTVKEIDAYEDYRTYVQNRSILTRRSVYSYLRIIETPLLPMLVRGGATHIRRGYGQTVHLEPTIYTEDPDNPDERNFNVTWFCLRYDKKESLTELGAHEYDTSNPSSPITDRSTVKEKDNKGGCFGKGPGLMKVASSDFELDTASFWSHDAVYELIAVIKKNHKITEGHLFVEVVKGKPPSLQVMCEKRVACIPDVHGVYINPSSYIPLRVECIEDCGDTKINYEWNIYATDLKATEKSPLENVEQHMRVDYDRVGVNQTLFLEHSDVPAFLVRAKGTLMNETVSEGISSILLVINHPPSKGKCKISEKSGFALIDLFHVKFSDWTDEDGHEIADYSVYLKYDDVYMRLSYGKKEKVEVVLPYGTHEIWCTVEDSIGAVTWYGISNFTTSLPTEEQLDEYEKSRFNDKCIAEGRMTLVSQIVIAKNSVVMEHRRRQNKSDVFDGVSEREIGTHWQEHLELEGIDSSYYTPQAKEEIREMLTENLEKEMNHEAIEKSRELSKILRVPMEALPDVEIFGGALSSVAENGPTDLHGKMKIMKGMENMYEIINQTEVPHPEAKKIAIGQLGSLADTVAGSLADSNIGGNFLPFELNQAEEDLNHNATEPNYFIYYVEGNRKEVEDRLRNRAVDEAKGNQLNDAKEMVAKIKTMISEIQEYCMEEIMAGPDPFYTTTRNGFQMTFYKDFASNLSNENIQQGDSSITLPNICKTLDQNDCDDNQLIVGIQAVRWTQPLESHSENSAILNEKSNVIQIDITSREGNSTIPVNNTGDPFIICIPVSKDNDPNNGMEFIVPRFSSNEDIFVYHTVFVDSSGVGVTVNLKPDNNSESLIVIYKYGDYPSLHDYDGLTRLDDIPIVDGIHSLFIGSDVIKESGKNLTVGIGQISNTTDVKVVFENPEEHNLTEANMTNQFSSNYSIKVATTGCYYFSDLEERWSTNGCQVVSSLSTVTCCACNHLTSFGSGFFIAPNKIDFSYVFSHAGFSNNVTIYATIIVIFSSFILFLIFARWKDRKDLEKLGATPLSDNEVGDKYIYEILVYTGNQRNSGTKSNVFFLVSGDDDETSVRHLSDDKRPVLQKGSIDVFVMATPRSLGQLNYLRIWHDNTGTGKWSSWFCRYIIFRDVQTGLKYEFIINKWLAVEYDDGMIDRLIPVSGKEQVTEFSSLFSTASQRNLADNHLWLSIFLRPTRSRFTRVQRVCCCTAVLCLSMLTNAMYYERTSAKPDQGGFKFGPLSLSPEQIAVGVLSNLMIFPPTFLMIFFFRKSRPKNLRPSRIEEAVKQQRSEWKKKPPANKERKNRKSDAEAQTCHRKKRFSLPWWCVYFGWFMVAMSIGASLFFMWAYGIEFGDEKTSKWLTSLVVSFFSSLLVTQPIKIILMTIVMSCICRSANYEDDDADDDEEDPYLKSDEEYLHEGQKKKRLTYQPMDTTALEEARKEREKEVKMHSMIREILTYFFFLWVITILSYGNRDPSNFYLREALINGFIKPGDIYTDFNFVNTERRFWNWTYNALLPELFAANWYNGRSPLGLRLFLDDRNNLKIGYAVLRQVRIHPRSCNVHWLMQSITPECAGYGGMVHEDGTLYTKGWIEVNSTETLVPPEYKYLTASQLKGYPFWGQIDWYGGGGYVVPLIAKRDSDIDSLRQRLYKIERDGWIDKYTRAIFVEFGVYNAQINLFCAVTILAEFLPGGGVVPYYHIDPLRLLNYHTGFGLIQLAVEILFVIFTVFFTYKEVSSMIQQGLAYFKQYWNNAEVVSIVVSYTGIANHIYKLFATAEILRIFTETDGTGYIKLQEAVLLNELFCYQIGLVMSISTLKFLKLLRFNKRIGILSSALRICGQELQSYAVCLMIVFMAFVILFWLLLGRFVREFSTFVYSFESSISMMLKKFNYEDMYAAQPVFTPIAFFTFSLATSLVLINILLSIIIRSFEDVKHDVNLQSDEYEVLDFFINRIKMMLGIGTAKVRPMPNLHGEKIKPLDSISTFPAKVDRLVDFINDFYFDSQMDFNSKEFLKKMNADTTMINKGGKRNARPVLKSKIPKSVSEQFDDF